MNALLYFNYMQVVIQAATKTERDSIEIKQRKLESIEFQKEMIEDEREELDEAKKHLKDVTVIINTGSTANPAASGNISADTTVSTSAIGI